MTRRGRNRDQDQDQDQDQDTTGGAYLAPPPYGLPPAPGDEDDATGLPPSAPVQQGGRTGQRIRRAPSTRRPRGATNASGGDEDDATGIPGATPVLPPARQIIHPPAPITPLPGLQSTPLTPSLPQMSTNPPPAMAPFIPAPRRRRRIRFVRLGWKRIVLLLTLLILLLGSCLLVRNLASRSSYDYFPTPLPQATATATNIPGTCVPVTQVPMEGTPTQKIPASVKAEYAFVLLTGDDAKISLQGIPGGDTSFAGKAVIVVVGPASFTFVLYGGSYSVEVAPIAQAMALVTQVIQNGGNIQTGIYGTPNSSDWLTACK